MINVAIIEDDLSTQESINDYLKKIHNEQGCDFNIENFQDAEKFLFNFETGKYDLALIDIELGSKLNGMEAAHKIRASDTFINIVFITSLAQYAIEGYQVNAIDYILKPITYDVFLKHLYRTFLKIEDTKQEKILVQKDGIKTLILVKEINYVEVRSHQITYHTTKGNFKTYGSLKDVISKLGKYNFSLCNSCYLVNLSSVERIDGYNVILKGNESLLISHPKRKSFLQDLSLYLGQ